MSFYRSKWYVDNLQVSAFLKVIWVCKERKGLVTFEKFKKFCRNLKKGILF